MALDLVVRAEILSIARRHPELSNREIASMVGVTHRTVAKWLHRSKATSSLADRHRAGRKKLVSPAVADFLEIQLLGPGASSTVELANLVSSRLKVTRGRLPPRPGGAGYGPAPGSSCGRCRNSTASSTYRRIQNRMYRSRCSRTRLVDFARRFTPEGGIEFTYKDLDPSFARTLLKFGLWCLACTATGLFILRVAADDASRTECNCFWDHGRRLCAHSLEARAGPPPHRNPPGLHDPRRHRCVLAALFPDRLAAAAPRDSGGISARRHLRHPACRIPARAALRRE